MGRRRPTDGDKPLAVAVQRTSNAKLGPIACTYASQASCPPTCPLRGTDRKPGPCYAEHGHVGIVTRRLNAAAKRATPLDVAVAEAAAIDALAPVTDLRLHVVGDCPDEPSAGTVAAACRRYVRRAHAEVRAFKFTHAWATVRRAVWDGVSVLASVERVEQVPAAAARGYASALVVAEFDDPDGRAQRLVAPDGDWLGVPCPAQTKGRTCATCRMCTEADALLARRAVILFRAHGTGRPSVLKALL